MNDSPTSPTWMYPVADPLPEQVKSVAVSGGGRVYGWDLANA